MLSRDLVDEDRTPVLYRGMNSIATDKFACPVLGYVGASGTVCGMRWHFRFVHQQDLVYMPGEGQFSKCGRCGMQVNPAVTGH